MGAKYSAAPLGLVTVAAMLPADWSLRLVDRNVEELRDQDLDWADLVLTGGMLPQQPDLLHLIEMAHARGKPVVIGGPDVTTSPEIYAGADFRIIGEAEEIMGEFLACWDAGDASGTFTSKGFPDLTLSPVPRYDLLELRNYMHVGIQFSRGCPFDCEFCNVIDLNGRTPRTKTNAQLFRELESLYALGYRGHVDFVDDNLIGNRKAAKSLLRELRGWLDAHGRPFEFTTEASLNLAADDELLSLMSQCNFFAVFLGIESPDTETLLQANKKQNVQRDIAESIRKIHHAGIFVNAGFIVGFDGEHGSVADQMVKCIEEAGIPVCMVGLLYALAGTKLEQRLTAEGRLRPFGRPLTDDDADQCTSGLNFVTRRPRADVLRDYRDIIQRLYEPAAYFGRVRRAGRELDRSVQSVHQSLRNLLRDLRGFSFMVWHMGIRDGRVRGEWWRSLLDCLFHNPRAIKLVMSLAALYLHYGPFSRKLVQRIDRQIGEALQEAPEGPGTDGELAPV
jgi:radical SAM superfamily enzyme YgiQ (UPF0313 family)